MRKKTIIFEAIGFCVVIFFIWINEIADIPHVIFRAPATPVNYTESMIESIVVLILAVITILVTRMLLKRIKYLEGFMRTCALCNKVYDVKIDQWVELKDYFNKNYNLKFNHGYCPECSKKMRAG